MHPITLRIPNDLLSEIDSEAEDLGYSTRAEYIRQLLQNRTHAREALSTEDTIEFVDPDTVQSNTNQIDSLESDLDEVTDRLDQIERLMGEASFDTERSAQTAAGESTAQSSSNVGNEDVIDESDSGGETAISDLEEWLVDNGPQKDVAQEIVIRAAEILIEDGPLSTGKLKDHLHNEYPDVYKTESTLWASTIGNVYQDAPGFSKPQYGEYDFE